MAEKPRETNKIEPARFLHPPQSFPATMRTCWHEGHQRLATILEPLAPLLSGDPLAFTLGPPRPVWR